MNTVRRTVAAFIASWGMISDYPLPRFAVDPFRMQIPSTTVLFCFPLTGALAGAIPYGLALLAACFFNNLAGALIFTILGGLFFFFKDSGRGLALLVSYIAARIGGNAPVSALQHSRSNLNEVLRDPVVLLLSVVGVIVVLGMLFALFYSGAGAWFMAVCAADALVQARLCLENDRNTGLPFIRSPRNGINHLAGSGIILGVLSILIFPKVAALGAVVILWVWFWRELPAADEFRAGLSSDWITMYGFWAGILTLLCGMGLL